MMGRLLDALRSNAESVPRAIPAIPLFLGGHGDAARAENSRIAKIAGPALLKKSDGPCADPAQQTARLLGMLRAEFLPESLLSRDDAGADGLAAMGTGELRAYALALHRSERMDAGTVPAEYTQAARCEGCGPVWLWEGCPPRVKACPWCFRRKAGRAFKRPPVECGQCLHFLPDPINPPGGGGDCGLGLAYRRGEPLRFPFAKRQCGEHRPGTDAEESAKGDLA